MVYLDFSVQPLCSLCLCGCLRENQHRGTENTEVAQRKQILVPEVGRKRRKA